MDAVSSSPHCFINLTFHVYLLSYGIMALQNTLLLTMLTNVIICECHIHIFICVGEKVKFAGVLVCTFRQ